MSVIALLATLLIPTLSGARESQYDVACKHNLKQLIPSLMLGLDNTNWRTGGGRDTKLFDSLRCPKGSFEGGGNQALNVTGSITELNPRPQTVVPNQSHESDTEIFGFVEREGYVLPAPLKVDITQPGVYDSSYGSTSSTIAEGTPVDSYYLKFDPVGSNNRTITDGSITFSSPIIGVIVTDQTLKASDPILGNTDTAYPSNQRARGFENGAERIRLSDDMLTLHIMRFHSTFPGEQVRIITESGGLGSGSYGINGAIDPTRTRPGQILLAEYGSSVIYPSSTVRHEDALDLLVDEDRLHFGRLNVGLVDGTVLGLDPAELESNSKRWYPNP